MLQETEEQQKKKKMTKHQMDPGTQAYITQTIIYNIQTKSTFRKKNLWSQTFNTRLISRSREQVQEEGKSEG